MAKPAPPQPTPESFKQSLLENLAHYLGKDLAQASPKDLYLALAYTVRNQLTGRWIETRRTYQQSAPKMLHYLSTEYLPGPQLSYNLLAAGLEGVAREAVAGLGHDLASLVSLEPEMSLGSGGFARLSSCFMESCADLNIPAAGYGLRYEHGLFIQAIQNGWQVEVQDGERLVSNPWEFYQREPLVRVGFGGYTKQTSDENGGFRIQWVPSFHVFGIAYDLLVPGLFSRAVNTLRLWGAAPAGPSPEDLTASGMAHPADLGTLLHSRQSGSGNQSLRLQQEYFLAACSITDILQAFLAQQKPARKIDWDLFPEKNAIHLNETHTVLAVIELMRVLLDDHLLAWDQAWGVTRSTFSATFHNLMPEALEEWPLSLFQAFLPRHLEILYEINHRFLASIRERFPNDEARVVRMSFIREAPQKSVRTAHLAAAACCEINGVSEQQSFLLREGTFRDFYEIYPERFSNKTNGVSHRRFLHLANPRLSAFISAHIGEGWLTNPDGLRNLEKLAEDGLFCAGWREVKQANKCDLAAYILKTTGVQVNPESLFDVMAKRMIGFKRQLLKVLHVITLYNRLKGNPSARIIPRTVIFSAKAVPGQIQSNLLIKLIHCVAARLNDDPELENWLKVVFLPDFNVALAQRLFPAADLSEQISLAGREASGTGNMKLAMNGAVTIGTLDGANIELRQWVGAQNFFLFGHTADEVKALISASYNPQDYYTHSPELNRTIDSIASGVFNPENPDLFKPIADGLLTADAYLILADYPSYIACQDKVARAYQHADTWTRMSILNTARSGFFSSDRAVRQYCAEIWGVTPIKG